MSDFAARLFARGMSEGEASAKARFSDLASEHLAVTRGDGTFHLFVPGRIEVLGKHTDYAGGRSLLCAAERGVCLVARRRDDDRVRVSDVVQGSTVEVAMGAGTVSNRDNAADEGAAQAGWAVYVHTAAARLAQNFAGMCCGADIAFGSDLPMAAGMSSSSVLVTSVALALAHLNALPATAPWRANISTAEDLAEYLGTIENGRDFRGLKGQTGVGTFGGSEDHTAMLCCGAGQLSEYSFCPVRRERQVPMPRGYRFVIAVSGVVSEKTGAARDAYNRASLAARAVLDAWNQGTGRHDATLRDAVESSADAEGRIRDLLRGNRDGDDDLLARFDQFVEETFVIIPQVAALLADGRVEEIADLVRRSQAGAERGLRNQVPETVFLAESACELGAAAASAFGAGFGGSVWALVPAGEVGDFQARWAARYTATFPARSARAQFFATNAGPGALGW